MERRRMADTVTVTGLIVPDHFHQAAVAGSRPAVKLLSHHPPPPSPPPGHFSFTREAKVDIFTKLLSLAKMLEI